MDTTETTETTDEVIGRFLASIEAGAMPELGVLSDDVVLDATVPNWRFTVCGADAVGCRARPLVRRPRHVRGAQPHAGAGRGARRPSPCIGEENGVPHAVHQAHVVTVGGGRIVQDQAWCGGRWPAGASGRDGRGRPW